MKNFVASGKTLTYVIPAETTVASGQLLNIDGFVGVATTSGVAGDEIEVMLEGVFRLPKATGTGTAFQRGSVVMYNLDDNVCINYLDFESEFEAAALGYAWQPAGDDDTEVDVFLVQATGLIIGVASAYSAIPVDLARLAQTGATDGQVIKWSDEFDRWIAGNDETGA